MSRYIDEELLERALSRQFAGALARRLWRRFSPQDSRELARQVALTITSDGDRSREVTTLRDAMGSTIVMCEWLSTVPGLPTFVAAALVIAEQVAVWSGDRAFISRVRALVARGLPDHVSAQLCPGLVLDATTMLAAANRLRHRVSTGDLVRAAEVAVALADLLVLAGEGLEANGDRDQLVGSFKSQRAVVLSSLEAAQRELAAAQ